MDYNQNIYDVFNYRKNNLILDKSIDDLLIESRELSEYMELSMMEFRSTCYMEDLVLEAMIYDNFNEEELQSVLEEVQENRNRGIKEKLRDAWEKLKKWIKAVGQAVRKFFESCRNAIRKAINTLLGKGTEEKNGDTNKQEVEVVDNPNKKKNQDNKKTKNTDPNVIDVSTTNEKENKGGDTKALPGGSNQAQLPQPQSEDDRLREKFKKSTLVVDIDDFNDIEVAANKAITAMAKICEPSLYTQGRDAILKAVGLNHPGGAYNLMRSYFMKGDASRKIPVRNLDPVKIRNIINNSDKYANKIQDIDNKCILRFGTIINNFRDNGETNYADTANFGLSLLNSLSREAVHFLRLQIQVYTKVMTQVIKGNSNPEENK